MRNKLVKIKTGCVFEVIGGSATVVEYLNSYNVIIEHNDTYRHRATVQSSNLRRGNVKNPYSPSVYGAGYTGVGEYEARAKGPHKEAFRTWVRVIERCYSSEFHSKNPTYSNCTMSKDWLNYQTFAEWFYSVPNGGKSGFEIDKDLRVMGSKTYSKNTCSFVPQEINKLLNDSAASRGKYPLGVKPNNKGFMARININNVSVCLGTYSTAGLAYEAYKKAKEQYVRSMADKWKNYLDDKVYANLIEWELD